MRKMISELNFIMGGALGLETMAKMAIMHMGYCRSVSLATSWLSVSIFKGFLTVMWPHQRLAQSWTLFLFCHHSLFTSTCSMG